MKKLPDNMCEIERLAIKVKHLKFDGEEEKAKKILRQLMDRIKNDFDPVVLNRIRRYRDDEWVSPGYIFVLTTEKIYCGIDNYIPQNFIGWAVNNAFWVISGYWKTIKKSSKENSFDFNKLGITEGSYGKSISIQIIKASMDQYESPLIDQENREFLVSLYSFFLKKNKEKLYKVLAWRIKLFPEWDSEGKYELKDKLTFEEIALEMGEIKASSSQKDIEAAIEKFRVWYKKALILAEEFNKEYRALAIK